MSAPALHKAKVKRHAAKSRKQTPSHIHFPSIHVRSEDGTGFDYEEDFYVAGKRVRREIKLDAFVDGEIAIHRMTTDFLCNEDLLALAECLPAVMDVDAEGQPSPELAAEMEARARLEYARQLRIAAGVEQACAACGCSETRACSGGCIWATPHICSRCATR